MTDSPPYSKKFTVEVDSEDPVFTNLPNKLYKSKGSEIWWKAKDNDKIDKFKVIFDGKVKYINAPKSMNGEEIMSTFQVPSDATPGVHGMLVKAYDRAGNVVVSQVDVIVR